jgi:hypothetical protein
VIRRLAKADHSADRRKGQAMLGLTLREEFRGRRLKGNQHQAVPLEELGISVVMSSDLFFVNLSKDRRLMIERTIVP